MSSKTKIVVLRSKELVYALVLAVISVLIIMTAVSLFAPKSENTQKRENTTESSGAEAESAAPQSVAPQSLDDTASPRYVPGIYSSEIRLGSNNAEIQITVDAQHINSITLANLDESISTLYPLMQPTLDEIASKIIENQSLEGISCKGENRYTSMLILQAIRSTLDKAIEPESEDATATTIY